MTDDLIDPERVTARESRYHYGSHQKLLAHEERVSAGSSVDAIVEPTIRPPSKLVVAAE